MFECTALLIWSNSAPKQETIRFKMDVSDEENDICTQDEDKYVNEIVKAILILDHSKKPFKQNDITKYLSKKPNRKQWNAVFQKSKSKLKEMGLILKEVKNSSAKSFILVSNVFPLPSMYKLADETEVADRTLLVLVLTFIFMKEGPVSNVDIFNHLQELNIYHEEQPVHEYFGDVKKKILNEFVSQLYLDKILDKESQTFEIRWGERALSEITKRSILEFVCEIGYEGTIQPKNLASHYQAAMEEENETTCNGNTEDELVVVES